MEADEYDGKSLKSVSARGGGDIGVRIWHRIKGRRVLIWIWKVCTIRKVDLALRDPDAIDTFPSIGTGWLQTTLREREVDYFLIMNKGKRGGAMCEGEYHCSALPANGVSRGLWPGYD